MYAATAAGPIQSRPSVADSKPTSLKYNIPHLIDELGTMKHFAAGWAGAQSGGACKCRDAEGEEGCP